MCSSFRSFIQLNKNKTERVEEKIQALERQTGYLRLEIEGTATEKYREQCRIKLENMISSLERCRRELRELDRINPERAGNSDNAVSEFIGLQWPHTKKLEINVQGYYSRYSLTTIPDLSHFTNLEELILDGHEDLCSGLERIPATVKKLSLYKSRFIRCDEIARLTKLEKLSLQRNYDLAEIPDLSGMKGLIILNVAQTGIKHLPNLPDGLRLTDFPCTVSGITRLEKRAFLHPIEMDTLRVDAHGRQKLEIMCKFIRKVRQSNQFRKIREELLQKAAIIALNPKRIARLLESGLDFDDLEDRDNLFGMK